MDAHSHAVRKRDVEARRRTAATSRPRLSRAAQILWLQGAVGNAEVSRVLQRTATQPGVERAGVVQRHHTGFFGETAWKDWLVQKLKSLDAVDPFGNDPKERSRRFVEAFEQATKGVWDHPATKVKKKAHFDRGAHLTEGEVTNLARAFGEVVGGYSPKARHLVSLLDGRLGTIRRLAEKAATARRDFGDIANDPKKNIAAFRLVLQGRAENDGRIRIDVDGSTASGPSHRIITARRGVPAGVPNVEALPSFNWFGFDMVPGEGGRPRTAEFDAERKIFMWIAQFIYENLKVLENQEDAEGFTASWKADRKTAPAKAAARFPEGRLEMYSQRVVCPSCLKVKAQFEQTWSTIKVDMVGG